MALAASELLGKVAIVTGSTSGIGRALVQAFAKEGACVTVTGRSGKGIEEVSKECQDAGLTKDKILCIQGDLEDDRTCTNLVNETIAQFGKLDILVNNAAISRISSVKETSMKDYDSIINVNCRSAVLTTKLAMQYLFKTKGNVINISSVGGSNALRNNFHYCMAKAALNQFTLCSALEFAEKGVRVNAVSPGGVQTPMVYRLGASERVINRIGKTAANVTPLKRIGYTEDVVNAVLFLTSSKASYITGSILFVDGGIHNVSQINVCITNAL